MTETFQIDTTMEQTNTGSDEPVIIPSSVLWIHGLPDDEDDGELEMRLARFGELTKLDREDEKAIATFKHTRAATEAKEKLDGFTLGSGRSISIQFAPSLAGALDQINAVTGEVMRGNRELHFKIGQLVRSTYSAMRSITGNYPPAKQNLIPEDFKYIESVDTDLELESSWSLDKTFEEKMKDYEKYADRRPFHNRYIAIYTTGESGEIEMISNFAKSITGESNLIGVITVEPNIFHLTFKSTRDASMIHSAVSTSITTGEGGLNPFGITVSAVKYAPPINTANSGGKLWFGCSAFLAVDEYRLRSMIGLFGETESFRLVANKNCLFVTFRSEDDAIRCRNKLFSYEIAPGHFLNTDFAPPAPEYPSRQEKRRFSSFSEHSGAVESAKKYFQYEMDSAAGTAVSAPTTHQINRLDLSKMGERMCTVLARKNIIQSSEFDANFILPNDVDICNRTKVDYAKNHLEKLGLLGLLGTPKTGSFTVVMWEFSAASERDCRGYDDLCDYFVSKDRVGFHSDTNVVTYFIPPVKQFLEPLGLPLDSRYLIALQMPPMTTAGTAQ